MPCGHGTDWAHSAAARVTTVSSQLMSNYAEPRLHTNSGKRAFQRPVFQHGTQSPTKHSGTDSHMCES